MDEGIIGVIKGKTTSKECNQSIQFNQMTIPDLPERVCDTVLGALVNGTWNPRRVIVTRNRISFAQVGNDLEIDVIPLAEISCVEEMSSAAETNLGQHGTKAADRKPSLIPQKSRKFLHRPSLTSTSTSCPDDTSNLGSSEHIASQHFVKALHIATVPGGYNSGRSYYLQAPSGEEKARLIALLCELSHTARKRAETKSRFEKSQDRVRRVYLSTAFQTVAALLIVGNFMANLLEAQFVQDLKDGADQLNYALNVCNLFFTAVFAVELMVNVYAHWMRPFLQNPWSLLDSFIVLMSLAALGPVNLPVSILRLMRAFRVVRLFGRLKALKKMIAALTASIVPMMNAFLILFIIAAIYSVMGVSLFADNSYQDFGRFTNAFITIFHLTSEGAWPPGLAAYDEDGSPNWSVTVFCMSYVVLVNWVVLQVSVAVLLDNFVSANAEIEEAERHRKQEEARRRQQTRSPLEPLLRKLSKEYVDDDDLSYKLRRLHQIMDSDCSGSLSCEEFCAAIKKLDFNPRIHVAPSDFLGLSRSGQLCDENGNLGPEAFEQTMRDQIRMYTQGQLCNSEQRSRVEAEYTHLAAIKWLMVEHQRTHRDFQHLCGVLEPLVPRILTSNRYNINRFEENDNQFPVAEPTTVTTNAVPSFLTGDASCKSTSGFASGDAAIAFSPSLLSSPAAFQVEGGGSSIAPSRAAVAPQADGPWVPRYVQSPALATGLAGAVTVPSVAGGAVFTSVVGTETMAAMATALAGAVCELVRAELGGPARALAATATRATAVRIGWSSRRQRRRCTAGGTYSHGHRRVNSDNSTGVDNTEYSLDVCEVKPDREMPGGDQEGQGWHHRADHELQCIFNGKRLSPSRITGLPTEWSGGVAIEVAGKKFAGNEITGKGAAGMNSSAMPDRSLLEESSGGASLPLPPEASIFHDVQTEGCVEVAAQHSPAAFGMILVQEMRPQPEISAEYSESRSPGITNAPLESASPLEAANSTWSGVPGSNDYRSSVSEHPRSPSPRAGARAGITVAGKEWRPHLRADLALVVTAGSIRRNTR